MLEFRFSLISSQNPQWTLILYKWITKNTLIFHPCQMANRIGQLPCQKEVCLWVSLLTSPCEQSRRIIYHCRTLSCYQDRMSSNQESVKQNIQTAQWQAILNSMYMYFWNNYFKIACWQLWEIKSDCKFVFSALENPFLKFGHGVALDSILLF